MNSEPSPPSDSQILDKLIKEHPVNDSILMNHFVEDIITFIYHHITEDNSSLALYDIGKDRVIFINSDITHFLSPATVSHDIINNRKMINDITHPDDIGFWDKTYLDTYEMMMTLPVEELKTFRVIGSRRLKENDDCYHSYIQRIEPLVFPEMKCPMYLIVKMFRVNVEGIPQFRLYSCCTEDYSEEHKYSILLKNLKLCSREMEALNLYNEGNIQNKIAEKMGIVLSTVKDYFKAINTKMEVHSIKVAGVIWKQMRETGRESIVRSR